jgi:hypothetical protein
MKICKRCSIEKDYDKFSITKTSKDGLNSWCKDCKSEYSKSKRENRIIKDTGTKLCTNCKIEKDVDLFSIGNNKDGLNNWCKDCNDEYGKSYYKENKERLKPIRKIWKENNLNRLKNYQKNRYITTDKERLKLYYIENINEIKENRSKYKETDEYKIWIKSYKLSNSWKDRYRYSLKNVLKGLGKKKEEKTDMILGYSSLDFKQHIESQFTDVMSWSLRDSFHIDHIIPISAFKEDTPIKIVNCLENLRPLSVVENLSKNNSIDYDRIDLYIKYIDYLKYDFVNLLNNI